MSLQRRLQVMRRLQGSVDYLIKIISQLQYELWKEYPYAFVAELNQEGLEYFGGVFENNRVPVISSIPRRVLFSDIGSTLVYLVDLETLQEQSPGSYAELFLRLSRIHSDSYTEILEEAEEEGLPLRAHLVEHVYSKYDLAKLEAPEIYNVVSWWDQFYG